MANGGSEPSRVDVRFRSDRPNDHRPSDAPIEASPWAPTGTWAKLAKPVGVSHVAAVGETQRIAVGFELFHGRLHSHTLTDGKSAKLVSRRRMERNVHLDTIPFMVCVRPDSKEMERAPSALTPGC